MPIFQIFLFHGQLAQKKQVNMNMNMESGMDRDKDMNTDMNTGMDIEIDMDMYTDTDWVRTWKSEIWKYVSKTACLLNTFHNF